MESQQSPSTTVSSSYLKYLKYLPAPPSIILDDEEEEEDPADTSPRKGKNESFMQAASSKALRPFVIISTSYLLFTITDGAIRMIVLLHAYNKSFSALEVAIMFTLYELAGVFTNLVRTVNERKRNHRRRTRHEEIIIRSNNKN
jgi:hypothetical protein